jgi:hypothetical protein
MGEKLTESIFYSIFFIILLYTLYQKKDFLKRHYIYKFKFTTKIILFFSILFLNFILLTILRITPIHWIFYSLCHALSSTSIVFFLGSIFWKNEKGKDI